MPVFDVKIEFTESGQAKVLSSTQRLAQEAANVRRAMSDASRAGVDAMRSISSSADDAADKFASLGKTVLGLVGAYKALGEAQAFISRGIKIGSEMESYKIGMATLITSMVKLEDGQGHLLEGAEKYQQAMGMAAKMMQRIQRLGLETTATTQSLVQGTQSIMASALAAGIQLEKVPDFAVAGAQAMQTLGIPLNQMRTELDALLTGVVNGAQDILAPKLFADKGSLENIRAYIKELKASGKLVDEIFRRLEPFKIAGQDIAQTYTGLMSNLEEAIDIVAMKAGANLLDKMKQIAQTAQDLFVDTKGGATGIGKDFENIAKLLTEMETIIGDKMLSAVSSLIDGVKSLNSWLGKNGADDYFTDLKASATAAAAGLAVLTVARRTHLAAAVAERGGVVASTLALAQNIGTITAGTASIALRGQKSVEAAQADLALAKANAAAGKAELEFSAAMGMTNGAFNTRASVIAKQPALIAAVEAAEKRLAVAERQLAAANFWGAFAGKAKAALSTFSAMLGGPVGIALTAATVGVTYLSTRASEQEKAVEAGTAAWNDYQKILSEVGTEADGTAKKLDNLSRAKLENAVSDKEREVAARRTQLSDQISDIINDSQTAADQWGGTFNTLAVGGKDYAAVLTDLNQRLKDHKISAADAYVELTNIKNEMREAGLEGETAASKIDILTSANGGCAAAAAQAEGELNRMKGTLDAVGDAAVQAAQKVQQFAIQRALAGSFTDATPIDFKDPAKAGKALAGMIANTTQGRELKQTQQMAGYREGLAKIQPLIQEMEGRASELSAEEQASLKTLKTVRGGLQRMIDTEGKGDPLPKGKGGGGGRKKGGGGRGGKSDAERIAENADRYSISLEKMRNEVEALENATSGSMSTYDRMAAKINAEKEAAIKNADVKARETVQRKQATAAQAEEMASLEKRKAELDANQKLDELQLKTLRDKSNFYKEFAELTGRTGESIALQNQLIDQQAKEWIALGVPMEDVTERVRLMKMEISDNPWDAMVLGLKSYAKDTGDLAKTMADNVKGAFDSIADSFTDLIMTGKMQFSDFANSIIRDLMRIMVQKAITGPIANGLGGLLGGVGQGFSNIMSGGTWDFGVASGGFKPTVNNTGMTFAFGGAFSGLHGYANQIVTRPTLFSYGSQLTRFAKGGVMGEAGAEAVMPLTRMGDGHLGVRAYGGSEAPVVNVVINNSTGQQASQQTKTDNQGNKSIEVMIGDMAAQQMMKTGTSLNKAARSFSGVNQPVTRR